MTTLQMFRTLAIHAIVTTLMLIMLVVISSAGAAPAKAGSATFSDLDHDDACEHW